MLGVRSQKPMGNGRANLVFAEKTVGGRRSAVFSRQYHGWDSMRVGLNLVFAF